jgi:hypothetical protein
METEAQPHIALLGAPGTLDVAAVQSNLNTLWQTAIKSNAFVRFGQDLGLGAGELARHDCPYRCREENIPEKLGDVFLGAVVVAIIVAPVAALIVHGPDKKANTVLSQAKIATYAELWQRWFVPRLPKGYKTQKN